MSTINYFELDPEDPSLPICFSPINAERPFIVVQREGEEDDIVWSIPVPSKIYDKMDQLPLTMEELLRFDPLDVGLMSFFRNFPPVFRDFCLGEGYESVPELSWEFLNYKFVQAAILLGIGLEDISNEKRTKLSLMIRKARTSRKIVKVSAGPGSDDSGKFVSSFQGALNKAKQKDLLFAMYWRIVSVESLQNGQASIVLRRDAGFPYERLFVLADDYIRSRGSDADSLEMIQYINGQLGLW